MFGFPQEALNNVGKTAKARQKSAKKCNLPKVNKHFKLILNSTLATQIIIQRFPNSLSAVQQFADSPSAQLLSAIQVPLTPGEYAQ